MFKFHFFRALKVGGTLIYAGCLSCCVNHYCGSFIVIEGNSMQPAIADGDVLIAERFSIRRHSYTIDDIIVAKNPTKPNELLCKRIKALPFDKVIVHDEDNFPRKKWIHKGAVWLEGDNRTVSIDSRMFGEIPIGLIRGKVFLRVWPLSQFGFIR